MCGIVGAFSFGNIDEKLEKKRKEVVSYMVTELLLLSIDRGTDATGIATLFDDGNFMGLKMGISAPEFVSRLGETETDYKGFLTAWKKYEHACRAVLGHCRKSSIGRNNYENANNHPIRVEEVVGVHNGTLKNHDVIFKKLGCKRDGEVDSEAIIRFAHHLTKNGTVPFTIEMLYEMADRIDGSFASLIFSGNNPFQIAGMRRDRPIELVLVRPLKTVFAASEKKFLEHAMWKMKILHHLFGIKKLASLTNDDLDFHAVLNDYVLLMDLTKEVDKETDIKDLIEEKKIRYNTINPKWKEATTTTTTSTGAGARTAGVGAASKTGTGVGVESAATTKKVENSTSGSTAQGKASSKRGSEASTESKGMLWNKALKKYQPESDTSKTDSMGNVEVDVDTGDIKEVKKDRKETDKTPKKFEIVEGSVTSEEMIASKAKIKEHPMVSSEKEDDDVVDAVNVSTIEVDSSDLCADSEALERAEKATSGLKTYETEEDVTEALSIESVDIVKKLSLTALVNRTKRIFYHLGFYDGYVARKKELAKVSTDKHMKQDEKKRGRERNIRILKVFTNTLTKIMGHRDVAVNLDKAIDQEIAGSLERREELDPETLKKLFSEGELRDNIILSKVTNTIEEKSKRK